MKHKSRETLDAMSPTEALQLLKEGHQRFVNGRFREKDFPQQITTSSLGQYPFAVILGCVDSRVSPELIFDQGIGDIFSIRIAGNFVNEDILGSMEFACKVMGSKHIFVLGHTSCGAIQGAYDRVELGHLTGLVKKLQPAVEAVSAALTDKTSIDMDLIASKNVQLTIEEIKKQSSILKTMFEHGEIGISGGMYDLKTGQINFLD